MEIKVGKYTLHSDTYCMWVTEEVKTKRKDAKTKSIEKKVAGYSINAEQLLDSFIEHGFRDANSKSMETYLKHIAKVERDAKRIAKGVLNGTQD